MSYITLSKILGNRILIIRKQNKLTQEKLAALSYINIKCLFLIEKGLANPTVKTLHKISIVLQISLHELFWEL